MKATTLLLVSALTALGAGCARHETPELVKRARLGVFYGGQVEERQEIPFELDPSRQTQGFRVEFSAPLATDTEVEYRIDMPKTAGERRRRVRGTAESPAPPRTTDEGKDVARTGETSLDHVITFHPGDPVGLWNVRVVVQGKVVIDRPVEVFDATARKRLAPRDAGP